MSTIKSTSSEKMGSNHRLRNILLRQPVFDFFRSKARQSPWISAFYRELNLVMYFISRKFFPRRTNERDYLKDNWSFEQPIEMKRYDRTLDLVAQQLGKSSDWGSALEIGCAKGIFTYELSLRCSAVTATDISPEACRIAATRCARQKHVWFLSSDLTRDQIPDQYDLVLALDVLDSIDNRCSPKLIIDKLACAVRSEKFLIISICHLSPEIKRSRWVHWFQLDSSEVLSQLAQHPSLQMIHQESYPDRPIPGYLDHTIAIFRKNGEQ